MSLNQLIDHSLHLAEILPVLALLWKVYRRLALFDDFPPHRHTNGDIMYPKGFTPGKIEHRKPMEETQ